MPHPIELRQPAWPRLAWQALFVLAWTTIIAGCVLAWLAAVGLLA
jgi:hypothetical protein